MKRYLSLVFLVLSIVIIIFGLRIDFRYNGVVAWGLTLICLSCAAYFTKYIPNEKQKRS
ncbi:MAG TPA: hypothetical protein VK136_07120 [Bacillota bacterium]|nr:hypothetical protein [Bacillota bacterium]